MALSLTASALLASGVAYAAAPAGLTSAQNSAASNSSDIPSAVEDFAYPDADRILREKNLVLKRGDGNITLAECGSAPDLLTFIGRDREDFCFRVTGKSGYLSLEVPAVTGVKSKDQAALIDMTVDGETTSYTVPKNSWKGVGETIDPANREHVLVKIVTSR
ncbi:hypothetical protein ACQEVM_35510 [Streptomyces sp. CA-243310]|uniref:hypothetical protein n=1 Tax=Streptomyces sp. CA-243310 TaxID=3240056 RepID=UPI003D8B35E6